MRGISFTSCSIHRDMPLETSLTNVFTFISIHLYYVIYFWRMPSEKYQNAPIRFAMSVCLCICLRTSEKVNGISCNLILRSSTKICRHNQILIKIGQK
jgi:hypothetical protein